MAQLVVSIWSVLVPVSLGCHPLTQCLFMLGAVQVSVEAHSGYNFGVGACFECVVPSLISSWSVHHDNHHRTPSSNYEPFFTYLDRAFGSLHPDERAHATTIEGVNQQAQGAHPYPVSSVMDAKATKAQ